MTSPFTENLQQILKSKKIPNQGKNYKITKNKNTKIIKRKINR